MTTPRPQPKAGHLPCGKTALILSLLDGLIDWLTGQLPGGSAAAALAVDSAPSPLFPGEAPLISRAGDKRRGEFQAGRAAARVALARMGRAPSAILAHEAGDPVWPAGVVGSITHTDAWALAVTAPGDRLAALGVDLEPDTPLEAEIVDRVCRPDEMTADRRLEARGLDAAKLRFVAKEAFYKAAFPRARRFIGFEEVRIDLDGERDVFEACVVAPPDLASKAVPRRASGVFFHSDGLICALCAWVR